MNLICDQYKLTKSIGCSSVDITRAEALGVPTEAAARDLEKIYHVWFQQLKVN